jgi:hypothetical protein
MPCTLEAPAQTLTATGRWVGDELIWTISRGEQSVEIENGALRGWVYIHLNYPFNHVDSIRHYHCEAYFNHHFNHPQPANSFVRVA